MFQHCEKKKFGFIVPPWRQNKIFSPLNGSKAQVVADQTGIELKEVDNNKGWLNGIRYISQGVWPGSKAAMKSELITDMNHVRRRGVFSSWVWQCVSWLQETTPDLLPRVFYKNSPSSWSSRPPRHSPRHLCIAFTSCNMCPWEVQIYSSGSMHCWSIWYAKFLAKVNKAGRRKILSNLMQTVKAESLPPKKQAISNKNTPSSKCQEN